MIAGRTAATRNDLTACIPRLLDVASDLVEGRATATHDR